MDWNSKEGRALLRAAYPAGYLAVRGVLTVGGWQCCYATLYDGGPLWVEPTGDKFLPDRWRRPGELAFNGAVRRGELLPMPDPADVATWAALLADLATTPPGSDPEGRYTMAPVGLTWCADGNKRGCEALPLACWNLCDAYGTVHSYVIDSDTDDPAEALVHARIQQRQKETES